MSLRQFGRLGKYGNHKTEVNGIVFDSKVEARRYKDLRLMEAAGDIRGLKVHPKYVLELRYRDPHGKLHREITYTADFEYFEVETGLTVLEDIKGVETEVFRLKSNLLCRKLPATHEFRVIRGYEYG